MNGSSFEINWNYDLFIKQRDGLPNGSLLFLNPERHEGGVTYKIISHLEEDITDYAFHRLKEISTHCEQEIGWVNRQKLVKLAGAIVEDFEKVHYRQGFFGRLFHRLMVALDLRYSEKQIRVLHRTIRAPILGQKVPPSHALHLIELHRKPQITSQEYDKCSLMGSHFERRYKELLFLQSDTIKQLVEPHLSIFKAHLKERVVKEIYFSGLPKKIEEGCYYPEIIPHEVEKILGPAPKLFRVIFTKDNLPHHLEAEVDRYAKHLTAHQLSYIKNDVKETILLYLKAYPDKTLRNAFVLGRDLIRFAVYQEIFDKSSFSGSDHGSKHIHHNIENAESLHKNMTLGTDYSNKDKLIERIIHFYHDIGYSVGLAATSFSCCKDHPLIGAKMIEENRNYFDYYLDKESTEIIWNGILLHAIALPNLSPDLLKVGGIYPGMVRAITSISDACAVTYDRKTQEFWEQSETLLALARFRLFLTKYPQYIARLAPIGKEEWDLLDKNNPLDVFAHDVFEHTKSILLKAVDKYDVSTEKKELFKQAIFQQFNSFTTSTTLGQFGGRFIGVCARKNDGPGDKIPKFFPEFELAPSIVYRTLHDLFGPEIAQSSFKKLVEEFGGNLAELAEEIDAMAKKIEDHEIHSGKVIKAGNARFKIYNQYPVDPANKHIAEMHDSLGQVVEKIRAISKSQYMPISKKNQIVQELFNYRKGELEDCDTFSDFVSEFMLPNLGIQQSSEAIKHIKHLTTLVEDQVFLEIKKADNLWKVNFKTLEQFEYQILKLEIETFISECGKLKPVLNSNEARDQLAKLQSALIEAYTRSGLMNVTAFQQQLEGVIQKLNDHADHFQSAEIHFETIVNAVKLSLVSDEEYRFMLGSKNALNQSERLARILNPSLGKKIEKTNENKAGICYATK